MITIQSLVVFLALCAAYTHSATITWTGEGGNGLWGYGPNWNTNLIPSAADDVHIDIASGANVTIAAAAVCNSLYLGPSGINLLIVQAQFTVGAGGAEITAPSCLFMQAPSAAPFSTSGNVTFNGLNTLRFETGALSGSGSWYVTAGSSAYFPGAGEKLILATKFYNYGILNIYNALVQMEQSGQLWTYNSMVISGTTTFLSQDGSGQLANGLEGSFIYNAEPTDTLTLSVAAVFDKAMNVSTGNVVIGSSFSATGIYATPATVTITGAATVSSDCVFDSLILAPGSTLSFTGTATCVALTVNQGKLINDGTISTGIALFQGGAVLGSGTLSVGGATFGAIEDIPLVLGAYVRIVNSAAFTSATTLLFGQGASLDFLGSSHTVVSQPTTFELVGAATPPQITMQGTLNATASITSFVNISGSGTYTLIGMTLALQAIMFNAGEITCDACYINAQACQISAGDLTGNGIHYINANPTATFGVVQGTSLSISAGAVSAISVTLSEDFNMTAGSLNVSQTCTTTDIFFYGGLLTAPITTGPIHFNANSTVVSGEVAKALDNVEIWTQMLRLDCGESCSLTLTNNGGINSDM